MTLTPIRCQTGGRSNNASQSETHFDTAAIRHKPTAPDGPVRAGDSLSICCIIRQTPLHLENCTTGQTGYALLAQYRILRTKGGYTPLTYQGQERVWIERHLNIKPLLIYGFTKKLGEENSSGGGLVAGANKQQPPAKIERKLGSTTYIVTSQFQEKGSTAVDKIRCLLDINTKANCSRQKS